MEFTSGQSSNALRSSPDSKVFAIPFRFSIKQEVRTGLRSKRLHSILRVRLIGLALFLGRWRSVVIFRVYSGKDAPHRQPATEQGLRLFDVLQNGRLLEKRWYCGSNGEPSIPMF